MQNEVNSNIHVSATLGGNTPTTKPVRRGPRRSRPPMLPELIPAAVRELKFRAHSFAAKLTPEQRQKLFFWLDDGTYEEVQAQVAAPPPEGFGMRVNITTLFRLNEMLENTNVSKSVTSAYSTACDLADSLSSTEVAPLQETLSVLLYSKTVNYLRKRKGDARTVNHLLHAITRLEKLKAGTHSFNDRRIKVDLNVSRGHDHLNSAAPGTIQTPIPAIDVTRSPRLGSFATSNTMLPVIENLLVLQDRDRKIMRIEAELANIGPERAGLDARAQRAQSQAEAGKQKAKQLESDRKKLELEVEAKKGLIEKYSLQQFQTKKNEEYRALAHEIDNCKAAISKLDDEQLLLMEQVDVANREAAAISKTAAAELKDVETARTALVDKEARLKRELADLKSDYSRLETAVEESVRERYVRLRKQRGATTVVGIDRGICGGCHMKLPMQIVLSCQAQQEIITCPQCSRILYFTREMDLAVA